MSNPAIRTTVVGSYPVPEWLAAMPSQQALVDATRVVFKTQELAGIDVVADGELYRFDVNHPDTNGMIEYFIRPMSGVRSAVTRGDIEEFGRDRGMSFRAEPAGVVEGPIDEGTLNLPRDYRRARACTNCPLKFTLTGPHMLSKTLIDHHYKDKAELAMAIGRALAKQVASLDPQVIQIDEANLTGHPEEGAWAADAINLVLDAVQGSEVRVQRSANANAAERGAFASSSLNPEPRTLNPRIERAVHLCFGNYGGQSIQKGEWRQLIDFMNRLHCDHVVLEFAFRGYGELEHFKRLRPEIAIGLGVVDVKVNTVETPELIARRIEEAGRIVGAERIKWVHPDCGFWMNKRSVADRKMEALVKGRDLYLGRSVAR
jgi:5-methyltetrahydropteroyltriglutamate--homocysteine methyltransferase